MIATPIVATAVISTAVLLALKDNCKCLFKKHNLNAITKICIVLSTAKYKKKLITHCSLVCKLMELSPFSSGLKDELLLDNDDVVLVLLFSNIWILLKTCYLWLITATVLIEVKPSSFYWK